jgi:hypothetical protein
MRPRLLSFWQRVEDRNPPPPVNLPDVLTMFRRVDPIRVEASNDALTWLGEMDAAKEEIRRNTEVVEEMKFRLGQFMLGSGAIVRPVGPRGGKKPVEPTAEAKPEPHELRSDGQPLLLINLQRQQRLDGDRIKEEYPEVAAECVKEISFFRFDPPRKKKAA